MILPNDLFTVLLSIALCLVGLLFGILIGGLFPKEKIITKTKTVIIDKEYGAQRKLPPAGTIRRPGVADYERKQNPRLAETQDEMTKTFEDLGI